MCLGLIGLRHASACHDAKVANFFDMQALIGKKRPKLSAEVRKASARKLRVSGV